MTFGKTGNGVFGMFWGFLASLAGAAIQANATRQAANAQVSASQKSVGEMRREFGIYRHMSQPFVNTGRQALWQQKDFLGLNGNAAQQAQMNNLMQSPEYQTNVQQSENALLANASATGGLRGGNTENSLAKIRPQILSGLEQQRLGNLANLSSMGQSAASGTGNAAIRTGNSISGQYNNAANAQASAALQLGKIGSNLSNGLFNTINQYQQQQQQQYYQPYGTRAF